MKRSVSLFNLAISLFIFAIRWHEGRRARAFPSRFRVVEPEDPLLLVVVVVIESVMQRVDAAADRKLIFRRTVRVRSGTLSLFAYLRRLRLIFVCSCGLRSRHAAEPCNDSPTSTEPSPSLLVTPTVDSPLSTSLSVRTTSV